MELPVFILLVILVIAVVLFSTDWISADVVAIGILLSLVFTGLLPADQAFAGFGSDAFILILGLLILTASLSRTGVIDIAGRVIMRHTGSSPNRMMVLISSGAAAMSAFMSNTASTAFFLPITIGMARKAQVSVSKLLMPLAFAAILASSVTLVATSTNIVVSGLMTQHGMAPLGMFELAPVGIPILIVGLVYMLTIGQRMIPDRASDADLTENFGLQHYLSEVEILPDSQLVGKTLAESGLGHDLDLTVVRLDRNGQRIMAPSGKYLLQAGDELLVEGGREEIVKMAGRFGLTPKIDSGITDPELQTGDMLLVEAILLPRSPGIGRRIKRIDFRKNYGIQVLAINRFGETLRRRIGEMPLRMGDVLLIQGSAANITALEENRMIRVLGKINDNQSNVRRAPIAIAIFIGALALATFNIVSLPVAVLTGSLLAFLTRCITPEEAYREVEWKILILIGSMLALGAAMEQSGTATFLASQIVALTGEVHPYVLLSGFFALAVLLTQPMSNQAAAVVVTPIAIQAALQMGLNERAFAVMVAVAASTSYLTPLEPACLMVYGPGRYRFLDFFKVGGLLTILIYLIALLLVPIFWPL
jgi:di/tricarboxylate transporter